MTTYDDFYRKFDAHYSLVGHARLILWILLSGVVISLILFLSGTDSRG